MDVILNNLSGATPVLLLVFWYQFSKATKVRDRQFRMLLARLNRLDGRAPDDFSSPLDGESEYGYDKKNT
ncbi:MAG: hypothetical protein COB36_14850 [Alphaproteobacteria bacterium]|nr:MAG: hypothetical protein COB36_14850 [Alphaproteobacteria bacterium]